MKHALALRFMFLCLLASGCSTLPEPEKEPFGQLLEKAIDAPSGDGIMDRTIEKAATTFPETKKSSGSSSTTPLPPRP